MSVTVLVYSLAPLMIALAGVSHVPFLFNAALQVGGMVGYIVVLAVAYRPLLLDTRVLTIIGQKIWAWSILFGVISGLDYALFVWSTRFIDISITTILFETWPFFLIALTAALFRSRQRYRRVTFPMMLLLTAGFTGCRFRYLQPVRRNRRSGHSIKLHSGRRGCASHGFGHNDLFGRLFVQMGSQTLPSLCRTTSPADTVITRWSYLGLRWRSSSPMYFR